MRSVLHRLKSWLISVLAQVKLISWPRPSPGSLGSGTITLLCAEGAGGGAGQQRRSLGMPMGNCRGSPCTPAPCWQGAEPFRCKGSVCLLWFVLQFIAAARLCHACPRYSSCLGCCVWVTPGCCAPRAGTRAGSWEHRGLLALLGRRRLSPPWCCHWQGLARKDVFFSCLGLLERQHGLMGHFCG